MSAVSLLFRWWSKGIPAENYLNYFKNSYIIMYENMIVLKLFFLKFPEFQTNLTTAHAMSRGACKLWEPNTLYSSLTLS